MDELVIYLFSIVAVIVVWIRLAQKARKRAEDREQARKERQARREKDRKQARKERQARREKDRVERYEELQRSIRRVEKSPAFQLTVDVGDFIGREIGFTDSSPTSLGRLFSKTKVKARRAVYDSGSGKVRDARVYGSPDDAVLLVGDEKLRELFFSVSKREPQPALEILKELFSAQAFALPTADEMGLETDRYKQSLKEQFLEFADRILELCIRGDSAERSGGELVEPPPIELPAPLVDD